jgi:hypothetical protein
MRRFRSANARRQSSYYLGELIGGFNLNLTSCRCSPATVIGLPSFVPVPCRSADDHYRLNNKGITRTTIAKSTRLMSMWNRCPASGSVIAS